MNIVIDTLREADLAEAIALSTGEGWNQTHADWRRLLRLAPLGCLGARIEGRLVGTVTTTTYERPLAWIGMMIVHPASRRRGIGEALMTRALEHIEAAGVPYVKLDATPAGLPLYRRLGFEEEVLFERWQGVATPTGSADPAPLERAALGAVLPLDLAAFGADRSRLLGELEADALAAHVIRESESRVAGFALARAGRVAIYLGPLIATEGRIAERLFSALIARFRGQTVCIEVNLDVGVLDPALLRRCGLEPRRPLTRMRRGTTLASGTSALVCASAGPEYG